MRKRYPTKKPTYETSTYEAKTHEQNTCEKPAYETETYEKATYEKEASSSPGFRVGTRVFFIHSVCTFGQHRPAKAKRHIPNVSREHNADPGRTTRTCTQCTPGLFPASRQSMPGRCRSVQSCGPRWPTRQGLYHSQAFTCLDIGCLAMV